MDFKSEGVKPNHQPAAPASGPHTEPRASAEEWATPGTCLLGPVAPMLWGSPPKGWSSPWARALLRFSAMGWRRQQAEKVKGSGDSRTPHSKGNRFLPSTCVLLTEKGPWAARKGVRQRP